MAKGISESLIIVRSGGDLATGIVQKLWHGGFKVLILEVAVPLTIRRTVALSEAVRQGRCQVEDLTAVKVNSIEECSKVWQSGAIPVLVDQEALSIKRLKPDVVVDAIIAKRNLGTYREMAPIVIALGPGFTAPEEVDVVVETMRGHYLGQLIRKGTALPNTGIPGQLGGKSGERVVHAPCEGVVQHVATLGEQVAKGQLLFYIDGKPIYSPLKGTLRGLISNKQQIMKGLKCADVDPRPVDQVDCYTISDKARALGGAVLEAVLLIGNEKELF
ncbi:selenium-dependent molybdenum cofactor biosynthesis protein YqeB [uncultured Vagococcus sp.]|uniref:selenium-dependent molybdenum cofactor biosynthesis protein YqeB n=1 Tax=uncultured Vagococcus sp. TaxID=189676 RepID=UPI0028D5BA21|nr:selenium-dependent molybdenum cofactor biosynthesis protein YqeB [uncultured Vagococcus sp.]